jgi:hypothetical protein
VSGSSATGSSREGGMCNADCTEPSLNELFADFAVQLLMQRDGVTESEVRALLDEVRQERAIFLIETPSEQALSQA